MMNEPVSRPPGDLPVAHHASAYEVRADGKLYLLCADWCLGCVVGAAPPELVMHTVGFCT